MAPLDRLFRISTCTASSSIRRGFLPPFQRQFSSSSSFDEKEKAEENRFFRNRDAQLLQKLRDWVSPGQPSDRPAPGQPPTQSEVEEKLRQIFAKHGIPTETSPLFSDLLAAFSSSPKDKKQ